MMTEIYPVHGDNPKSRRSSPHPDALAQISYIHGGQDTECREQTNQGEPDDIIAQILGKFGIWQLRSVLIIFLCKIPAAWFMACIIFTAPDIYPNEEFSCDTSAYGAMDNCSVSEDQCSVLVSYGDGNYAVRQCQQFHYAQSFHSLIMEFDLVCLCDIFVAWSQYWHLFGMFVGGVVATRLMRVVSPRRVYISGIWALLCCGVATGLVNDFSLHCSFRCLSAVSCSLMMTAGQTIFTDITSGKYRQGVLLLYETFWSLGIIVLPAIAVGAHSWRQIYIGITSLPFIIVLLLPWLPDSPRWQLQRSVSLDAAVEHVMNLLHYAASINDRNSKIPYDLEIQLQHLGEKLRAQPPPARWLELWHGHKRAKLHMLATHMALATFLIGHMGLLLNIRSFGRDYLSPNTMVVGVFEILGCILAMYLTFKHNAHKWQWAGGFCIVVDCVGCFCWFFTHVEIPEIYEIALWMFFAVLPKAGISCAQAMILTCMGESLPPEKRAPFAFSVVTWARVWLLSASFLTVLKELNIALSLSTFCVLVILGGICTCCLRTPVNSEQEADRQQEEQYNDAVSFNTHL
ncbi:LOW QUALITY PROTEIN: solute carrier family 22 member 3 [Drosophila albomicans]|uniref:LOW QUALITY PROTEIN: solute carrier family 22 member 3 n=1 Tax=Drosophila albomicans TaxID=7291 RepID=A0A6P8XV69_DROAB|nr:LOW QUALITY PROTEIN: solute carrier family 22 member 3 [Drosophila albomicans]